MPHLWPTELPVGREEETVKLKETVACDKCGGSGTHPDLLRAKCSRCGGAGTIPWVQGSR